MFRGHALLASVYRARRSNNCGRPAATRLCCFLFIRSIRARPPAAVSTSGDGCFDEDVPVHCVDAFYRHELYLQALVEKIDEALARFADPERPEIVFSAHSVPVAVIHKGDPYQRQIEETVELVMQRGGWTNRLPPLLPEQGRSQQVAAAIAAHARCASLRAEKDREVCIVPISFVSDHVETLGEIDHEARAEAAKLGIKRFEMTSGLNDSPTFIAALADLVGTAIGVDLSKRAQGRLARCRWRLRTNGIRIEQGQVQKGVRTDGRRVRQWWRSGASSAVAAEGAQ